MTIHREAGIGFIKLIVEDVMPLNSGQVARIKAQAEIVYEMVHAAENNNNRARFGNAVAEIVKIAAEAPPAQGTGLARPGTTQGPR
jgi:hypothetical protein